MKKAPSETSIKKDINYSEILMLHGTKENTKYIETLKQEKFIHEKG